MILCFVDSSAATKLFLEEPGSEKLRHYLTSFDSRRITVSRLASLEVSSALQRYVTSALMSLTERDRQIDDLDRWLASTFEIDIDDRPLALARQMMLRHEHLRSLDAIQLASASLVKTVLPAGDVFLFIASDRRLLKAAKAEGFEVWDPADPGSRPIAVVPVN